MTTHAMTTLPMSGVRGTIARALDAAAAPGEPSRPRRVS